MPGPKAYFEEGQCSQRWHGSVQRVYYIIITIYQEARLLERVGKPRCQDPRLIQGPEEVSPSRWAQCGAKPSGLMMMVVVVMGGGFQGLVASEGLWAI